jgi:alanine racemase
MNRPYPIIAQIDTDAIRHNCNVIKGMLPPSCQFGSMVKCNAYGHGIDLVLPTLKEAGAKMLGVATIAEAQQLRELDWDGIILLLMPELGIYRDQEKKDIARLIVKNEIRITCVTKEDIEVLDEAAEDLSRPAMIHLMLDTGMSRMGLYEDELIDLIDETRNRDNIILEGLFTHFVASHLADKHSALEQLERFNAFRTRLDALGVKIPIVHTANTGAVLDLPDAYFNMVRPGLGLYGYYSNEDFENEPDLKPALKLLSYLTLVKEVPAGRTVGYGGTYAVEKDMTIGLVPIGYGDGYDRRLSNTGIMTIEGYEVPVIGRISMDQTILDLTEPIKNGVDVRQGTEVTVIDNDHNAVNSVKALAKLMDTVPYEVVTNLGTRILRLSV